VWDAIGEEFRHAGAGGGLDADRELARVVYGIVAAQQPATVVETGVARGITARSILEAGTGHLYSIDLPPKKLIGAQSCMAVPGRLRGRWTYLEGTSRRHLPSLLRRLGQVDLFIHDSLHTQRNMRFEIARGWKALRPGGILVADDIGTNDAFTIVPPEHAVVAQETAKPGMFGVAVKPA
jgi:predicted O-methyltransferase YrrM